MGCQDKSGKFTKLLERFALSETIYAVFPHTCSYIFRYIFTINKAKFIIIKEQNIFWFHRKNYHHQGFMNIQNFTFLGRFPKNTSPCKNRTKTPLSQTGPIKKQLDIHTPI
jgi:hypothetical protein